MQGTVQQLLTGVAGSAKNALQKILAPLADRYASCVLQNPGLVINGAGSAAAKTGLTPLVYIARGIPVSLAAGTVLPSLTSAMTFTTGQFMIVGFFGDAGGTLTVASGNPGSTLAKATFPLIPVSKAILGFLVITYAGTFVGGTTPLDTATTIFVSPYGTFDPSILVQ